jgi:phage shock protein PspC (stress-responsive transcriptional regulator)
LLIFIHGRNNGFLERQIKVFVVTSIVFIVIIYFVYAISLPSKNNFQE